jgi:YHS domain-containing protein
MMRNAVLAFLLAAHPLAAFAQEAPEPEQCLAIRDAAAPVIVTHAGKTYQLASDACRAQFLSDPERYAQLYDALLELAAEGQKLRAPAPSLVPS